MASPHQKLSLPAAILININVMLGAGLFINTTVLAQYAGMLGAFGYVLIGILMLPLILSIATLLRLHPGGNFYTFASKQIHPYAGFISSWSYFTGKLASASLMIHVGMTLLQAMLPSLKSIPLLGLDMTVLGIFVGLNLLNVSIGSTIQTFFMGVKSIPIMFVILTGLWFLNGQHISPEHLMWDGIPSLLPLVLYATVGFEAACSLSSKIENAERNAPRAVLISYAIVIVADFLYQFFFYGALGSSLRQLNSYHEAFPTLTALVFDSSGNVPLFANDLLYLFIAASAMGGAYGIMFSNTWNVYALAHHGHLPGTRLLTHLNSHAIPATCVAIEGFLCALYLLITYGNQIPLQQISALGCVIAFSISALSLVWAKKSGSASNVSWWIPLLATMNCAALALSCIHSLTLSGPFALAIFGVLLVLGTASFFTVQKQSTSQ